MPNILYMIPVIPNYISVIALKYYEKDYPSVLRNLEKLGSKIYTADRDGVGSISKAFNTAVKLNLEEIRKTPYLWFVTNIGCHKTAAVDLANALETTNGAAIHPQFKSDHPHISGKDRTRKPEVQEIPFIEFTAPMIRTDVFLQYFLDEDFWFYYMDLVFSKQLRDAGLKMYVHYGVKIEHVYLRNSGQKEEISKLREKVRQYRDPIEVRLLREKFGEDWRKQLFVYEI